MSRNHRWIVLIGLIGVLGLAAIGGAVTFGGFPLPADVANTAWTLRMLRQHGQEMTVPAGVSITLTFTNVGHTFSSNSGCNYYSGTFTSLWLGRLTLRDFKQTAMACLDGTIMEFAAAYLQDLGQLDSYRRLGGGLISRPDGSMALGDRGLILTGNNAAVVLWFAAGHG